MEAQACPDHIHMLISIPPKISVSYANGYLKGKSSLMIFDRHNPVELLLAEDCVALMPMDFDKNIALNLPCQDILHWFAEQNEGEEEPFTFYAVLTLNDKNRVTQLAYQYFPWG